MTTVGDFLQQVAVVPFCDVGQLLQKPLDASEWLSMVNTDATCFSRHRLFVTPLGDVEVLVLTWPAGYSTLPHDHAEYGCWLRVLQGSLTEVRYNQHRHKTNVSVLEPGVPSFMCNDLGYHSIANNTPHPAYSLHVYSPPFHRTVTVEAAL